jgi:hypothetical protein
MFKHAFSLLACAAVLAPAASWAQDKPIAVFFRPCNEQQLNDAITAALSQPPFLLQTKAAPGVLVFSIPDKVQVEHGRVSGISWTFNVAFSRDGNALGQSVESCNENKLSDCTDQLRSDVRSAAGTRP